MEKELDLMDGIDILDKAWGKLVSLASLIDAASAGYLDETNGFDSRHAARALDAIRGELETVAASIANGISILSGDHLN